MSEQQRGGVLSRSPVAVSNWLYVLGYAVWAGGLTYVAFSQSTGSWVVVVVAVLGSLTLAAAACWLVCLRLTQRQRYMQAMFPADYALGVVLYTYSLTQWRGLVSGSRGVMRDWVQPGAGVVRLSGRTLELIGGIWFGLGGKPKTIAEVKLPEDTSVYVARAPQGLYVLRTIELRCEIRGEQYILNMLPIKVRFGLIPLPIGREALESEAAKLRDRFQQANRHRSTK